MLNVTIHDINELIPDPDNVRQHGPENHNALLRSIKRFGIRKPIVAHEATKIVYAGNETLRVALELGMTEIPVAWIPAETPESVCRAYAIADNRINDLSEFDEVGLTEALAALQADGEVEIGDVGFSLGDVEGFSDFVGKGRDSFPIDIPEEYLVVIDCRDESEQADIFEKLQLEGYQCRLLI